MRMLGSLLLVLLSLNSHAQKVSIKLGKNAVLILERAPFNAAGKKLEFYGAKQPNGSKSLTAIDGKTVFGVDGELPKYVLQKAVLVLNGRQHNLLVSNMYNPWFGQGLMDGPSKVFFKLLVAGKHYKLQGLFSDGAGSYAAEWAILGNTTKRIMLTADEDQIVEHFSAVSK